MNATESTLTVGLGERAYPIHIGVNLSLSAVSRPCFIVTDSHVAPLYLDEVRRALAVPEDAVFILPAGETSKTWDNASAVLDALLARRFPRDGLLIALGGGVIGDLAGFVASIYQRGIDFWQIPTTLLAMVDSSVGGKTAVNHPRGKNLIGAFHQPKAVFADLARLATLPARELSAGLAEVIKYGLLGDAAFFAELEQRLPALLAQDPTALAETVAHCCRMKATIVARDERETGERALLNLGHTFGHAVEAFTHYQSWLHGEAVGLGLLMAADISWRLGQLPEADKQRIFAAVQAAGLPVLAPQGMTAAHFWHYMAGDKKVAAGKIRFIVLQRLGQAEIRADIPQSLLQQTLEQFTRQTS